MKSKVSKFYGIFAFITLFLLFVNCVYAAEEADTVLSLLKENSSALIYETIGTDDAQTGHEYVMEIGAQSLGDYIEGNSLLVDGEKCSLKITYEDSEGNKVNLSGTSGSIIYFEEEEIYIHYLATDPSNVSNITYSLIKEDGTVLAEESGTLNVKRGADGNISSKVVSEFKRENILTAGWGLITGDFTRVGRMSMESLCSMSIPVGDAFLHMIGVSIGEPVTIDKAVFDEINKLDIDFFSGDTTTSTTETIPLKNIMKGTVNTFYSFFRKIAFVIYMVILVYIGLKTLLSSTADKKSAYKGQFMAWVMGVAILVFFPYVMKYCIKLNSALCQWVGTVQQESTSGGLTGKVEDNSRLVELRDGPGLYGNDKFILMMLGSGDLSDANAEAFRKTAMEGNKFGNNVMMEIRYMAAHNLDLPLAIVYFILIGELLAILIIYYKRVFMIGFLIAIFPLVVAIYPLNKIGDIRVNSFGVWFKEFLVNVFVQTFHAVTYTVVVTIGVNSYLSADNWLFMIMCVLFLFEGEKIIRAIFNVKSSMNTIGDMAAAGVMAMSITRNVTKMIPTFGKDKGGSDDEDANAKAKNDREKARAARNPGANTMGAASNLAAATGGAGVGVAGSAGGGGTGGSAAGMASAAGAGGAAGEPEVQLGRETHDTSYSALSKKVDDKASKSKVGKASSMTTKVVGGAFSGLAQVTGGTMGLTFGMAQQDSKHGMDAAVAGGVSGMNLGKEVGNLGKGIVGGITGKVANVYAGYAVANEFARGEHDEELDISEADMQAGRDEAIRQAYAKAARRRALLGNEVAEITFMREKLKIIEDINKEEN